MCTIYADRERMGFGGCIAFECFGAGQFVTQHVFNGQDWRGEPSVRQAMVDSFLRFRPAFDLLYLARRFEALDTGPGDAHSAAGIIQMLEKALLSADPAQAENVLPRARAELRELYAARRTGVEGKI